MPTLLKNGLLTDDPRLDRVPSETTEHLEKYPLTAATLPSTNSSMVMGVNWYSNFDAPKRTTFGTGRGGYYVIGDGDLGRLRGGHATCLKHYNLRDEYGWYEYYNQGTEGRCVEFSSLRMLSLNNRKRYDITSRWHYHQMQYLDEWPGGSYPGATPVYEGTSVRAAMEVLRHRGAIVAKRGGSPVRANEAESLVRPEEGISTYRWAMNWQDVRTVLNVPDWMPGVPMLNSWGTSYPKQVILLDAAGERLLREDGEFGVVTDR